MHRGFRMPPMKLPHELFMTLRFSKPIVPRYITQHTGVIIQGITDDAVQHAKSNYISIVTRSFYQI